MLLLLAAGVARAHEPGLSSADFAATHNGLELVLTFAVGDMDSVFLLDNDADNKVSQLEFGYAKERLTAFAAKAGEVMIDGKTLTASEPTARMDELNNIEFIVRYPENIGSNF